MYPIVVLTGITLVCFVISSIPFGYIIPKLFANVDIRTIGSKNIGATNAGRILGKKGFVLIFILDMLKGFLVISLLIDATNTEYRKSIFSLSFQIAGSLNRLSERILLFNEIC